MSSNESIVSSNASQKRQQRSKFDDIAIVSKINQANFSIFLSYSSSIDHYFALKVFPYKKGKISRFFENEIRFSKLRHQNIISPIYYEPQKLVIMDMKETNISYTLMEFAPYGDFFDLIIIKKILFDDKLARTYFHQLIAGLEYLHSKGVAHLDIKPENLLLGTNFQLKISDFDHSVLKDQPQVPAKGTLYYRAPEIYEGVCEDYYKADIYSAGILLFLFKSGGMLPHVEHKIFEGVDLLELLNNNIQAFWQKHCEIQRKSTLFFDEEFKSLFTSMVKADPKQRPSLTDIKSSNWFNGPVYNEYELIDLMEEKLQLEDE